MTLEFDFPGLSLPDSDAPALFNAKCVNLEFNAYRSRAALTQGGVAIGREYAVLDVSAFTRYSAGQTKPTEHWRIRIPESNCTWVLPALMFKRLPRHNEKSA